MFKIKLNANYFKAAQILLLNELCNMDTLEQIETMLKTFDFTKIYKIVSNNETVKVLHRIKLTKNNEPLVIYEYIF